MTTVASRRFVSIPQRDAASTWRAIVDLLTRGQLSPARTELLGVGGVAACIIADKAPERAAIVVTCDGPRTRVYCLYDGDAIDGADKNEDPVGYDALSGDWRVSLPCWTGDLAWVQSALKKEGGRVSARDAEGTLKVDAESDATSCAALALDVEEFMKP